MSTMFIRLQHGRDVLGSGTLGSGDLIGAEFESPMV